MVTCDRCVGDIDPLNDASFVKVVQGLSEDSDSDF